MVSRVGNCGECKRTNRHGPHRGRSQAGKRHQENRGQGKYHASSALRTLSTNRGCTARPIQIRVHWGGEQLTCPHLLLEVVSWTYRYTTPFAQTGASSTAAPRRRAPACRACCTTSSTSARGSTPRG